MTDRTKYLIAFINRTAVSGYPETFLVAYKKAVLAWDKRAGKDIYYLIKSTYISNNIRQ